MMYEVRFPVQKMPAGVVLGVKMSPPTAEGLGGPFSLLETRKTVPGSTCLDKHMHISSKMYWPRLEPSLCLVSFKKAWKLHPPLELHPGLPCGARVRDIPVGAPTNPWHGRRGPFGGRGASGHKVCVGAFEKQNGSPKHFKKRNGPLLRPPKRQCAPPGRRPHGEPEGHPW